MLRTARFVVICAVLLVSAVAQAESTAKVGLVLPLTGAIAEYGIATRNGIELARTERGDLFKSVQFAYEDSE